MLQQRLVKKASKQKERYNFFYMHKAYRIKDDDNYTRGSLYLSPLPDVIHEQFKHCSGAVQICGSNTCSNTKV